MAWLVRSPETQRGERDVSTLHAVRFYAQLPTYVSTSLRVLVDSCKVKRVESPSWNCWLQKGRKGLRVRRIV